MKGGTESRISHEVYSVSVIKGYDSLTIWVARVGDQLVLMNIKTNFITFPVPRKVYVEMLKVTLLEVIKKICAEGGVECKGVTIDPEMPLNPKIARKIEEHINYAKSHL